MEHPSPVMLFQTVLRSIKLQPERKFCEDLAPKMQRKLCQEFGAECEHLEPCKDCAQNATKLMVRHHFSLMLLQFLDNAPYRPKAFIS